MESALELDMTRHLHDDLKTKSNISGLPYGRTTKHRKESHFFPVEYPVTSRNWLSRSVERSTITVHHLATSSILPHRSASTTVVSDEQTGRTIISNHAVIAATHLGGLIFKIKVGKCVPDLCNEQPPGWLLASANCDNDRWSCIPSGAWLFPAQIIRLKVIFLAAPERYHGDLIESWAAKTTLSPNNEQFFPL